VVAQQLFTKTVKRGTAIHQQENGSSNHGEPFFMPLPASPKERRKEALPNPPKGRE